MKIVLSFEEYKARLEEQGKNLDGEDLRSFDWLAHYGALDLEECHQLLESFEFSSENESRKMKLKRP